MPSGDIVIEAVTKATQRPADRHHDWRRAAAAARTVRWRAVRATPRAWKSRLENADRLADLLDMQCAGLQRVKQLLLGLAEVQPRLPVLSLDDDHLAVMNRRYVRSGLCR
jgi:hypothetical protein